ncbi:hypothetical protein D3C84_862620 [compost metagenome]
MGRPVPEAITTVAAVASWAAKPRLGVRWVMPVPTVAITFSPMVARPMTIPMPPSGRIHQAMAELPLIWPALCTVETTAESGPMALATSLEPWAKAMAQAVITIRMPNTFSTLAKCILLSSCGLYC